MSRLSGAKTLMLEVKIGLQFLCEGEINSDRSKSKNQDLTVEGFTLKKNKSMK